jgi:hypothetical protein
MINLPSDRLPVDPTERRRRLECYFGDLISTAEVTNGGWSVRLERARFAEFYVDPALDRGLTWWGPDAILGDIYRLVRRHGGFQLSLDDSWTLYDWSLWLSERHDRGVATDKVTILHVDDHTDFMTPRIARNGEAWLDLITGRPCDLTEPETVKGAILSGAVGIGSFMAPFLHRIARCDFRHLSQSVNRQVPDPARRITLRTEQDTLLSPGARRPSLVLEPWDAGHEEPTSHRYFATHRPDEWLEGLQDAPVLLHIDMDYFNNRFDRDSDWHGASAPRHDPDLAAMSETMDELFDSLARSGMTPRIESVAVALSPGFFPAEFWQPLTERLAARLGAVVRAGLPRSEGGGPS